MLKSKLHQNNIQFWAQHRVPACGVFELTPLCNLDCRMCYVHLRPDQLGDRRLLTADQWLRVADQAVEENLLYVLLTGGECLLYPGFHRIYTHLRDRGVLVSVNTNATVLTDEMLELFRSLPPVVVNVTLYGADEEGYERCTGRRMFGAVMENLRRYQAAGINLSLSVTVNRCNAPELDRLIDLVKSFRLPFRVEYDLTPARPETGRDFADFALSPEENAALLAHRSLLNGVTLHPAKILPPIPAPQEPDPDYHEISCGAGKYYFVVKWDGQLAACFDLPVPGANVLELGFAEAWARTQTYLRTAFPAPVECRTCPLRSACLKCVARRMDFTNPGHADPARCALTRARLAQGVKTLASDEVECESPL